MFKLEKIESVLWPVHVDVPCDGGTVDKKKFHVRWKVYDRDELGVVSARCKDDVEFMAEVMTGFGTDVLDAAGQALPFTPENRDRAVRIPYVHVALVRSFYAAQKGVIEKN